MAFLVYDTPTGIVIFLKCSKTLAAAMSIDLTIRPTFLSHSTAYPQIFYEFRTPNTAALLTEWISLYRMIHVLYKH